MDDEVLDTLYALLACEGALKIITAEWSPNAPAHADPRLASSWVCHDVVSIVGPDGRGLYRAFSKEGDWTTGRPGPLLARLRQWRER